MTLTITKQEDEQRQMTMSIEVADKRVVGEMKKIARKLAKDMRFPGFRPEFRCLALVEFYLSLDAVAISRRVVVPP